jgi:hypothetical protein
LNFFVGHSFHLLFLKTVSLPIAKKPPLNVCNAQKVAFHYVKTVKIEISCMIF